MKVDSAGGGRALGGPGSEPGRLPRLSEEALLVSLQCPCGDPPPFGALGLISFGDLFTNGELEESGFSSQR